MTDTERMRLALELLTLAQHDPAAPGLTVARDVQESGPEAVADALLGLVGLAGILLLLRRAETGQTIPDQLADLGRRQAAGEALGL